MRRSASVSLRLSDLLFEILHRLVRPWYRRAKTIERVIVRSQNTRETRGTTPGSGGPTTGYRTNNAGSDNSQPNQESQDDNHFDGFFPQSNKEKC